MILISFLGKGNYQEASYYLPEEKKEFKSKFFVQALNEFYKPDKIIIFMTDDAEKTFEQEISSLISFEKKKIKDGKNEEELWENFEILADAIPKDDEIIIDVTHGFRSIPIVALSVIIFLNILNDLKVKKVLYGAFEARDFYECKAPVFDITNFMDLINWSYATDEFLNFGIAKRLRDILVAIHNMTYKQKDVTKAQVLRSLGQNLDEITTALSLIRPEEVLKSANMLPKLIESVKEDIQKLPQVKPLGKLLDKISNTFVDISEVKDNLFDSKGFKAQAQMIEFYIKIEKYQQAITLAREAIVSYVCCQENLNPEEPNDREKAEKTLNELSRSLRERKTLDDKVFQLAKIWQEITNYRNDINHAGMRKNPIPPNRLINNITEVCNEVKQILN